MRPRNLIVNIERECIYFDLPRAVSIFSELHARISARVRFLRALQNWKARASSMRNCNVILFRVSPEKFYFNTARILHRRCTAESTRHLILRMHRGAGCVRMGKAADRMIPRDLITRLVRGISCN